MEIELGTDSFETEVLNSETPVLVDFWAPWCGPCRMLAPVLAQIAQERSGLLKVCKVNVDEEEELASKFEIMSIPTLLVFKEGKITNRESGIKSVQQIEDML